MLNLDVGRETLILTGKFCCEEEEEKRKQTNQTTLALCFCPSFLTSAIRHQKLPGMPRVSIYCLFREWGLAVNEKRKKKSTTINPVGQ